ncbi:unnamed protein product, partial [Closterium sp. Naga37s-1]
RHPLPRGRTGLRVVTRRDAAVYGAGGSAAADAAVYGAGLAAWVRVASAAEQEAMCALAGREDVVVMDAADWK